MKVFWTPEAQQDRERIPHENYRLVYEVVGETVWLLTLIHTSRQWPPVQR